MKFEESITTIENITNALKNAFPTWQEKQQNYQFLAYNFSYLSLHLPRIIFHTGQYKLVIDGLEITVILDITLRINGTVCFEYQYVINGQCNIETVVEKIQAQINVSYKHYLKRIGAYKNAMSKIELPENVKVNPIFENGLVLDTIKLALKSHHIGVVRDYEYPYQHGRLLYSWSKENTLIEQHLLTREFRAKATEISQGELFLDTWKTVIIEENDKREIFLELYLEKLANYFECQSWIFQCEFMLKEIDDKTTTKQHNYKNLSQQAKVIEALYFSCNRKMINFTNLSIPFKNDYYTQLSKSIIDAIKLDQHIAQTHQHFSALKEHINTAKMHTDTRTEKHTKVLKIFMALNFSAGIASLIPASLDGDLTKFGSSMLPPLVWLTFMCIAMSVFFLESRDKS